MTIFPLLTSQTERAKKRALVGGVYGLSSAAIVYIVETRKRSKTTQKDNIE